MSTVILDTEDLRVIRYCGPATPDGSSPVRYEISRTAIPREYSPTQITLSRKQMEIIQKLNLDHHD